MVQPLTQQQQYLKIQVMMSYLQLMSDQKRTQMRLPLCELKVIIIDEISMVCNTTLLHIHQQKRYLVLVYTLHKWIVLFACFDWLTRRRLASTAHLWANRRERFLNFRPLVAHKTTFWSANYSAGVIYTKTIIHLSVTKSDAYLLCSLANNHHYSLWWIIIISIYTLSDLGVLSNLIGSLSLANEHYSPPTEWIMRKPNKNKMAGVNAWIESSIKSIFNAFLLKMLLRSLPVYILKQLFFSISVNSGRIFPLISKNNC